MVVTGTSANIVIIGCGVSGIAAARRLVEAGFQHVRILEATARSGGRIKTRRWGECEESSRRLSNVIKIMYIPFVQLNLHRLIKDKVTG